jgi:hypothetical protein
MKQRRISSKMNGKLAFRLIFGTTEMINSLKKLGISILVLS